MRNILIDNFVILPDVQIYFFALEVCWFIDPIILDRPNTFDPTWVQRQMSDVTLD